MTKTILHSEFEFLFESGQKLAHESHYRSAQYTYCTIAKSVGANAMRSSKRAKFLRPQLLLLSTASSCIPNS